MGARSGGMDSLNSLLSDLGGVEGSILARPKTLGGMKKTNATPKTSSIPSMGGSAVNVNSVSASPSQSPWGSEANLSNLPGASHSVDNLEELVRQTSPQATTLPSSEQTDTIADDTLDWSFSEAAPIGAQTPQVPASAIDDPFADFNTAPPATAMSTEDPLSMFGGTPVPAPVQPSAKLAPAVADRMTSGSNYGSNYKDFHKEEEDVDDLQTTGKVAKPFTETATEAVIEPAVRKPIHRAFDYLDSYENDGAAATPASQQQPPSTRRPEGVASSGPLAWSPSSDEGGGGSGGRQQCASGSQHYTGKESVAEIGHKAAKVLQIGTKWFMNTSKQLAKDVHAKIEHHRHAHKQQQEDQYSASSFGVPPKRGGHPSGRSAPTVPAFYYDWASQLARMSPGSRAAALGAMDEGDRLEVQQIIDEAELGDAVLLNSSGPGEDEMPNVPPPAYEDVVNAATYGTYGTAKFSTAAADVTAKKKDRDAELHQEKSSPPPPLQEAGDLLGGDGMEDLITERPAQPVAVQREPSIDLLGLNPSNVADGPSTTSVSADTSSHIDAMFSVPPPGAQSAVTSGSLPSQNRIPAAAASTSTKSVKNPSSSGALDSMIHMQEDLPDVDITGFSALYAEGGEDYDDVEGESEIRRALRHKRIAEKHERMMRQLAEKRSREDAEDAEKAGKVAYREQLKPRIAAWTSGKKDNIRALLSTLHVVLWEGSGWTSPSIADLMEPSKVKRWYMKANLVVHPDKVKQKGGTIEQVATADVVFDVLKSAWGKFETAG